MAETEPSGGPERAAAEAARLLAVAVQAAEEAKGGLEDALSEMWAEADAGRREREAESRAKLNATCNALHLAIPLLRHAQLEGNESTLPDVLDLLRAWPEADAIDLAEELDTAYDTQIAGTVDRLLGGSARGRGDG